MKLATQLSLLIVGALLVAIAAMGAFFAFNLERGFVAYINAQQSRQLEALAQAATRVVERTGSIDPLVRDRRLWGRLLRETQDGAVPSEIPLPPPREQRPPGPPPFGGPDDRPPGDGPPDRPFAGPPPGMDPLGLGRRFFVLGPDRHLPPGEPLPPSGQRPPVEREIRLADGRVAGYVVHYPFERASRAEDLAFLRSQFMDAVLVALALLLAGVLVAPLVARRWTRELRAIGQATARVARGERGVRVAGGGAREIEALAADVNAMAASLARLDESRKQWIAQSAHELRTPLMVLRGEIDALQDGVRPLGHEALASLAEEAKRLAKLVDDLHLVAVADMDGLPCQVGPTDLGALARRAVERFAARAAERGLSLSLDESGVLREAMADDFRVAQLLDNLLENTLRYTDAPGRVVVSVSPAADAVVLRVDDTPPGVTPEACARLFDPLYRADAARSRKAGGSGLGLAVCRAIANAHGAPIAAVPSPLGGLRVEVRFPLAR